MLKYLSWMQCKTILPSYFCKPYCNTNHHRKAPLLMTTSNATLKYSIIKTIYLCTWRQCHDFFYIAPLLGQCMMCTGTITTIWLWSSSNAYEMKMHMMWCIVIKIINSNVNFVLIWEKYQHIRQLSNMLKHEWKQHVSAHI